MPKYPKEEWEEIEKDLHQYLINNPFATEEDIIKAGYNSAVAKFHKGSINEAKKAARVPEKYIRVHKLSEEEWGKRKKGLHQYLIDNPNTTKEDIIQAGHNSALDKFHKGSINEAKKAVRLPEKYIRHREYSKEEEVEIKENLHQYLIDNPDATKEDVEKAGHYPALKKFHGGRINEAKKYVGVPEKYIRHHKISKEEEEEIKENLHQYLLDNPNATVEDVKEADHGSALDKYKGNITKAKKDARVPEKYIRHREYSKEEEVEIKENLRQYLIDNPDATKEDVEKAGHGSALYKYKGNITKAKKDARVPEKYIRRTKYSKKDLKEMDEKFKKWLKEHPNASREDACKAGFYGIIKKNYHNKLTEAKEKCEIPKENIYSCREPGFWTKETIDKAYDELKREIKEKEDRQPTSNEFRKKYGGAIIVILKGGYPGVKNWTEYVNSRGDKPINVYRDKKTKSEIVFNYFSSDASLKKIGNKLDVTYGQICEWSKESEILDLICKKIGIDQSKIFNKNDLIKLKIHESKIDMFLNKLTENEIAYQIGEDYTTDKRFLDDFNSIFEGFKELKKRGRRLGVTINGKSHEYSRDMVVDINETKEREVTPVKRNNKVKRIGVIEDKGDYFQLLGMFYRLKKGNSSFDYQKQMQELETSFVKSYINSPEWISQYKLADFLIGD